MTKLKNGFFVDGIPHDHYAFIVISNDGENKMKFNSRISNMNNLLSDLNFFLLNLEEQSFCKIVGIFFLKTLKLKNV